MNPTTTVRIEKTDGIGIVTLDKPPVNAIDLKLVQDADRSFRGLLEDDGIGAVVITGGGKCFCAGLDLKTIPFYSSAEQRQMVEELNRIVALLYALPLPTVAAINGHAIAGGFILAISCDYRVGPSIPCRIGITESRVGIPFPISAMEVLCAELSPAAARRMTLMGRNTTPENALADGVLDELQPVEAVLPRALEMARELASIPSKAYGTIKHQLRGQAIARIEEAIRTGSDPLLKMWISEEAKSSSTRFLDQTNEGD